MDTAYDVLVVGGGIAGITAAIEAARHGARTAIACHGPLFGGSSFYPGTWGLGLIGPESPEDESDLMDTIENVGCGMADHVLVETFVRNLRPSIAWLEHDLGVSLKRPTSPESACETTFIPCFDHKHRMWRGITRDEFEVNSRRLMDSLPIDILERCELMQLVRAREEDAPIQGAVLFDAKRRQLLECPARAIVLAAGGTGGLFERSLTSNDVLSSAHGLALDAGCSLVNIEFMQMMPGLVAQVHGVVFNEKTFRYALIDDARGMLPHDGDELSELLEMRSGHGPFTCRIGDELLDMAIDAAGSEGLPVRYRFPTEEVPEFVQTFARWMQEELGIGPASEMRIAMYAHAANGGIRIDEQAGTGVPGLYACGEVTGGMHGADRIGGLSSANGLVFGKIAGTNAAHKPKTASGRDGASDALASVLASIRTSGTPLDEMDASCITRDMKHTMTKHAMIQRTEEGLTAAIRAIERLQSEIEFHRSCKGCVIPTDAALARGIRASSQLKLAHAMLSAMRSRRESRGSHYRADFPPR